MAETSSTGSKTKAEERELFHSTCQSITLMFYFVILFVGASGGFSTADLSQLKDGMARVTGKVSKSHYKH